MTILQRAARFALLPIATLSLTVACSSDESDDGSSENDVEAAGTGGSDGGSAGSGGMPSGGGGGTGGTTTPPEPVVPLDPTWLACTTDADCTVIEQQRTCVACFSISVNSAHVQDVTNYYAEEVCTERRSAPCPPAPEGPICNEKGVCDFTVDCEVMEKAQLCGEHAKCSVLAAPPCGGGTAVRVGCFPKADSPTPGRTCAEDPATGQQLLFLSDEIPPDWTVCDLDACEAGINTSTADGGGTSTPAGDSGAPAGDGG